jgi:hypothetical protein
MFFHCYSFNVDKNSNEKIKQNQGHQNTKNISGKVNNNKWTLN